MRSPPSQIASRSDGSAFEPPVGCETAKNDQRRYYDLGPELNATKKHIIWILFDEIFLFLSNVLQ
jgi:hypothetical protein